MELTLPRKKNYSLNKVWKAIGRSLHNTFVNFQFGRQCHANRIIARQLQAIEFPYEDYYFVLNKLNRSALERLKRELR